MTTPKTGWTSYLLCSKGCAKCVRKLAKAGAIKSCWWDGDLTTWFAELADGRIIDLGDHFPPALDEILKGLESTGV